MTEAERNLVQEKVLNRAIARCDFLYNTDDEEETQKIIEPFKFMSSSINNKEMTLILKGKVRAEDKKDLESTEYEILYFVVYLIKEDRYIFSSHNERWHTPIN